RRPRTAVIDDTPPGGNGYGAPPDEPGENGHSAEAADNDFVDLRPPERRVQPAPYDYEATVPVDGNGVPAEPALELTNGATSEESLANGALADDLPGEELLVAEAPANGAVAATLSDNQEAPADATTLTSDIQDALPAAASADEEE